eukprot:bmy_01337T0
MSLTLFTHSGKVLQHWIFTLRPAFSSPLYHLMLIREFYFLDAIVSEWFRVSPSSLLTANLHL